jgi:hypothetical protein
MFNIISQKIKIVLILIISLPFTLISYQNSCAYANEFNLNDSISETNASKDNNLIETKNNHFISIESGVNGSFLQGASTALFNFKILFPNKIWDSRCDFLIDYSLGLGKNTPVYGNAVDQYAQMLFFGVRYYFDVDWVVSPYAMLSIGVIGTHLENRLSSLMAIPIVSGGFGFDYMFTQRLGLNAEISAPIVAIQFKLGLKLLIITCLVEFS